MPEEQSSVIGHSHPNPEHVTETDYSPPRGNPFPVVGIGVSAGGLEAFSQLLRAVPEKTGIAFVLVQHLDPQHESLLPELLTPATNMPVQAVEDGMRIEPDHVYVIPPNTSVELRDSTLCLATREPGLHLPIDIFFRSLADVQGSRAIGIVLSGNASDGSLGVRAIKAECGITFAQDEASARFGGMPRNAVATGAIDYVLSPADIGRELGRLAAHRFMVAATRGAAKTETLPEDNGDLRRILASLHAVTKVDFTQYKPTTIRRRVGRRMMVLRVDNIAEYARYVQQKPSELNELYKDVLISVTSFFRDPATFDALLFHLTPALTSREDQNAAIRVWVPGCATGEEVYSLAICLYEFLQEHQISLPVNFFGTDISEAALECARHGVYSAVIEDDVPERRLRRFFTKSEGGYVVNKMIRESCVFARHDVTRDPPFSRLDVVSCRNVLIYLDSNAQRRVLPSFHYALNPTGLLMLGSAETPGAAADLFTVIDKSNHIYARKAVPTRLALITTARRAPPPPGGLLEPEHAAGADLNRRLDRVIQAKYSPDAVVVDSQMQILQFRGRTAPYLDPTPGEASLNFLRMARENLVLPLRRILQKAAQSQNTIRDVISGVELEDGVRDVLIEVTPVHGDGPADRCFLVVFAKDPAEPASGLAQNRESPAAAPDELVNTLRRELAENSDYLRHLTEQYEAHAEELRAANEETRSANEELQSTNEELGTTKEELQSANEELTTVNEELQNRNRQVGATNSDLKNLLSAVTLAIVMVDDDLRVRRFNAAAEKLLKLTAVDIGRPVGHLRGRIETPRLEAQIRRVIETLAPSTEEVQDSDGLWYSLSVRPYRTVDDRIVGAVITFQDIDTLRRGLETSEAARQYAEVLLETVRQPLVVFDADLRVHKATSAFYETFMVSREETEGRFLHDLGNGQWNNSRLRELLGDALFRSFPFQDFEVEHDFPHIGRRTMRVSARRIPQRESQPRLGLFAVDDVTARREIAEIRFHRLFETAKDGIVVIDAENHAITDVNKFFLELTGCLRHDFIGRIAGEAGAPLGLSVAEEIVNESASSEIVRRDDVVLTPRNGVPVPVDIVANRYLVGSRAVAQLNIRDIRARKRSEKQLRESEERFRLVVESVRDYAIFQLDGEGRIISWNVGAERVLGWREEEVIGRSGLIVFTPEDIERGEAAHELAQARAEGRSQDDRWHLRKDGSRFFASGVLTCVNPPDGEGPVFTKIMQDITARWEQDQRLRQSLEEKSTLVREIHHRVKNNLQTIVSLLNLQASHTTDIGALAAFEEAEGRVRAISQIHEQLYASQDLREVEVAAYLKALAEDLVALHSTGSDGVELHISVQQLVLPIERAIPLGLIANELIINSLKHGLRRRTGSLDVTMDYSSDMSRVTMRVCDTGAGFPADFDPAKPVSMGYRLVNLLLRQLRGQLEIGRDGGASVTVEFPAEVTTGEESY